jgi:hypothetical protein
METALKHTFQIKPFQPFMLSPTKRGEPSFLNLNLYRLMRYRRYTIKLDFLLPHNIVPDYYYSVILIMYVSILQFSRWPAIYCLYCAY